MFFKRCNVLKIVDKINYFEPRKNGPTLFVKDLLFRYPGKTGNRSNNEPPSGKVKKFLQQLLVFLIPFIWKMLFDITGHCLLALNFNKR